MCACIADHRARRLERRSRPDPCRQRRSEMERPLGAERVRHRVPAHARRVRAGHRRGRQGSYRGPGLLGQRLLGAARAGDADVADRADGLRRGRVAGRVAAARVHGGAGDDDHRRRDADGPGVDGRVLDALGPRADRWTDVSAVPHPETSTRRLPSRRCGRLSGIDVHLARRPLGFGAVADGDAEELHGGPGRADSHFDHDLLGVQPDSDGCRRGRHDRDAAAPLPPGRRRDDERGHRRRGWRPCGRSAWRSSCARPRGREGAWLLARRRARESLRAEPRHGIARSFRRLDLVRRERLPHVAQRLQLRVPVRGPHAAPKPGELHARGHARRDVSARHRGAVSVLCGDVRVDPLLGPGGNHRAMVRVDRDPADVSRHHLLVLGRPQLFHPVRRIEVGCRGAVRRVRGAGACRAHPACDPGVRVGRHVDAFPAAVLGYPAAGHRARRVQGHRRLPGPVVRGQHRGGLDGVPAPAVFGTEVRG